MIGGEFGVWDVRVGGRDVDANLFPPPAPSSLEVTAGAVVDNNVQVGENVSAPIDISLPRCTLGRWMKTNAFSTSLDYYCLYHRSILSSSLSFKYFFTFWR